ncbi:DUF3857 domain-containing protein [Parvularcula oceani]|uniref:DUF3857 domain-containing protein n=1 Tax=Parvularcula oceani TaxID=1247963 RepID=UPI0004E126C4|nr:DUF3857 domain-containing protein [Parvularcula oceani]
MIWLGGIAASAIMTAALANGAESYSVETPPGWVVPAEIPDALDEGRAQAQNGRYVLLYDTQVRLGPQGRDSYRRIATLITSRAGLEEEGRLTLGFDPSDTRLVLHGVRLWRDGAARDVLPAMTFQTARQEDRLDDGIVDGDLTVFGEIPGLRVGDIIDWEASWRATGSHWPGELTGGFSTQWSVPSGLDRWRVLTEAGTPLSVRAFGPGPEPERSAAAGYDIREWRQLYALPVAGEGDVPGDVVQWGSVTYSTFTDWAAVADWARPFYALDAPLPDPLRARMAGWDGLPLAERVTRAIRLVQDEVRYVSDSVGLGAYRPRPPAVTWANGYGDCKDKALLLAAILRTMGVEAVPALASTERGLGLAHVAPSPGRFDHVVVRVPWEDGAVWIDATRALQGGVFPALDQPRFGYALPIEENATLEAMPRGPEAYPTLDVVERYDLSDAAGEGVALTVEAVRRGAAADAFRNEMARRPLLDLSDSYLDYYRTSYPGLSRSAPLEYEDDRAANRSVTTERYLLPAAAFEGPLAEAFPLNFYAMEFSFPQAAEDRTLALAIPHPVSVRHEIALLGWEGGHVAPEKMDLSDDAFRFTFDASRSGDDLRLVQSLVTKSDRIEPSSLAGYSAARSAWLDQQHWNWEFRRETEAVATSLLLPVAGMGFGLAMWGVSTVRRRRRAGRGAQPS